MDTEASINAACRELFELVLDTLRIPESPDE